jgi:hypothetical protein
MVGRLSNVVRIHSNADRTVTGSAADISGTHDGGGRGVALQMRTAHDSSHQNTILNVREILAEILALDDNVCASVNWTRLWRKLQQEK